MSSSAEKRISLVIGKDFRALQEERVLQYKKLNEAHKIYLASGPSYELEPFQVVVTEVTNKFKTLSKLILDLQARAESDECRNKTLANLIKKVQMFEEKKLHLTVDLQLSLQQAQDNPEDDLMQVNSRGIQNRLQEIIENINDTLEELKYHTAEIQGELDEEENPPDH